MKALVTGGAGFIGSHLVRALLARGDSVRVLDNFSTGKRSNLEGLKGRVEIHEGDIRDVRKVSDAVKGVDYIFHEAAEVSVTRSMNNPQECFDINVQGTLNIFEAARKYGVQRIVTASSCAVYGDSENFPLSEKENTRPLSPYATSKYLNEKYASFYTKNHDLPVVALRYFNVYGPRQSPDSDYAAVIPIFIHRTLNGQPPTVYGDGRQSRDFVFVGDVVRANLLAAQVPEAAGGVFNVCTGVEYSLLDLLDILRRIIQDTPSPVFKDQRTGDIYRSLGDPSMTEIILGFRADVSLSEGLKTILESKRQYV